MAPQRPSSPTSLLWAHQLKREHNYLLQRMTGLESSKEAHEDRIKTAETAAKSIASGEIASLAGRITTLEHSGLAQRFDDMEKDVADKIDDVQAGSEAMVMQIAALQRDERAVQEDRRQALNKDKALLSRIGEVEEGLKKYERGLESVGRKINEQQMGLIKKELDVLTKQVTKEGMQMKLLTESVEKLEQANDDLKKANERLEKQLEQQQTEQIARTDAAAIEDLTTADDAEEAVELSLRPTKKSHKWSGGGADRDIVRVGATLFPQPQNAAPKRAVAPRKTPAPPKKPKTKKGPVPQATLTPGVRKSHKWNGGGADRDIVSSGQIIDEGRKRRRSTEEVCEVPSKKARKSVNGTARKSVDDKARKSVDGKAIIRSGRGWYEVVESDSSDPGEENEE